MLLILFLTLNGFLFSQENNFSIYGKVVNQENNPIKNALVGIEGTFIGDFTNEKGVYKIKNLKAGEYVLFIKCAGYKTLKRIIKLQGFDINANFILEEDIFEIEQIVVTGSSKLHNLKSTPALVQIVDARRTISSGKTLNEELSFLLNFDIKNTIGRTQALQINGFNPNHTLVMVDGEKISGKIDGAFDLNSISMAAVERIEIVKGPYSALYGSEAMGGAINIITKKNNDQALNISYNFKSKFQAGRTLLDNKRKIVSKDNIIANEHDLFFNYGLSDYFLKEDLKHFFDIGISYYEDKGVDYYKNDNFSELPASDRKSFFIKARNNYDNRLEIENKLDIADEKIKWQSGDKYNPFRNQAVNDRASYFTKVNFKISSFFSISASYNFSKVVHLYDEFYRINLISSELQKEKIEEAKLISSFSLTNWNFSRIGSSYEKNYVESIRIEGKKKIANAIAIFGETEFFNEKYNANLGARLVYNEIYGSFLAPKISALYKLSNHINLRFSYGKGYREPSLKELYIKYINAGVGYTVIGEPSLKPEKSDGFNFGFEYFDDKIFWIRSNFYYNKLYNLIDWYYKGQNVLSYYNIRKSTIIGIDAEANFNFFDKTFLNLKYDKIYAADENKNFLPFRSPNSISLRASQKIYDLKLTVQSKWTDKKKVSVAQVDKDIYNQNSTASYFFEKSHFIIDFMFSGCFRKYFNYSIGVNNMLDRRSYPFGPIRGREIFISMSYEFINR